MDSSTARTEFEFHKSFFSACSCDFEQRQANCINQSIAPLKFVLKRTYIEDHFAIDFNRLKPLVLRDLTESQFAENSIESLAIAIPTARVLNKNLLADALSQFASFDCVARSEFHNCHSAFEFGELAGSMSTAWFADALPSASNLIGKYVNNLKPANKLSAPAPMYVIFKTEAGNEVAIPISQAREWETSDNSKPVAQTVSVSPEFKDLVDSASVRLQWAGGRLSAAAAYMSDWFSDRLAHAKSNDLR
jgi:hypothetical protein